MIDKIEIVSASALEMENVVSTAGKLTGSPVFYKQGVFSDAMIVRVYEGDKVVNTSLMRVNQEGRLQMFDRTKRLTDKPAEDVEDGEFEGEADAKVN